MILYHLVLTLKYQSEKQEKFHQEIFQTQYKIFTIHKTFSIKLIKVNLFIVIYFYINTIGYNYTNIAMFLSDFDEIELSDEYILRRPIADENDAETLLRMYANPSVAKYIPDDLMPSDMKSSIGIIEYYRNAINKGNMAYWSIAKKSNNKMIGLIGFCDINYYNSRAEIAYELDPEYWRQGITLMAVKKISQIMFEKIGIKRIQANIVPDNISSLGLLNKAGFIMEGLLYSYRVFKGKQIDVVMVALSSDKYFNDIRLQSQVTKLWNYIPSHSAVVKKMKKCV